MLILDFNKDYGTKNLNMFSKEVYISVKKRTRNVILNSQFGVNSMFAKRALRQRSMKHKVNFTHYHVILHLYVILHITNN
jgi:hypothetical protein